MSEQLNFDLPTKPALGRYDFFVSPANALAVALIDTWADWPQGKLLLYGPEGSGKSHLAHVWAAQSGARIVKAAMLKEEEVPPLASTHLAVEDVHEILGDMAAETTLFHLHNLALSDGRKLLFTGQGAPKTWGFALADLQSRLTGTHQVALTQPDDALLLAVLAKLFADRQISPRPDVIPYLVGQIDRSFIAAAEIVDCLDQGSLAEKRNLTRAFAAQVLAEMRKQT